MEEVAFSSFRFASYKTKDTKKIIKNIRLFVNTYSENNELDMELMQYFEYFCPQNIKWIEFFIKK